MGFSVRYFLFPDGAHPKRIPHRVVEGMVNGKDFMPEYAGTRQKVLSILLESVDGDPSCIHSSNGSYWEFDEKGAIGQGLRDSLAEAMNSLPELRQANSTVVPITSRLNRKRFEERFRWAATKDDLDLVAADLWPNSKIPPLKAVVGVQPKRPPLTYEAKQVLFDLGQKIWAMTDAIENLSRPGLKGLAFEARRLAEEGPNSELYRAVAAVADVQIELQRRRRSGKGVWIAYVYVTRWDEGHRRGEVIESFHEECSGRPAAVAAARRMLAEHANKFSADVTVEAGIEWNLSRSPNGLEDYF